MLHEYCLESVCVCIENNNNNNNTQKSMNKYRTYLGMCVKKGNKNRKESSIYRKWHKIMCFVTKKCAIK